MTPHASIQFFDTQFKTQVRDADLQLNPFEQAALDYLKGRVLDYGCGLGNLAVAAARNGCSVLALDASPTAIGHLQKVAQAEALPIHAAQADLRRYELGEDFDAIVCIGLLMFFDCPTAFAQLRHLQAHVRPGGVLVVNVLVEGTTYRDMFDLSSHCLLSRDAMLDQFVDWEILHTKQQDFPAPGEQLKSFMTVTARKPERAA